MHPSTTRFWRAALAATTALAAALGATVAAVATGTAAQAAGCQVAWSTSSWPGGFTADVRVTPGEATHGWTLTWTWPSGQDVTQAWSSSITQSGSRVTVTNAPWNGELAAGSTASFGFQGTWAGANADPTDFVLNGVACNGGTTPTQDPTDEPTQDPTDEPTQEPTDDPTDEPTQDPTDDPTQGPTDEPTDEPTGGPVDCASAVFCDGLETQTSSTPTGAWTTVYPDCSGSGRAAVDSGVAHSGSRSLRIDGAVGYCNHVFVQATQPLTALTSSTYVRFWVRHSTPQPVSHTTFLAMKDANDGNRDLRMGGQNSALQWNRSSDDATLPEQSPAGVALSAPLPTGTWHCVEALVEGAGRLTTWLDGSLVTGLVADGTPTHDVDGQWSNKAWSPRLTDLRLGWESYGDGADTLWFDDVVVAGTRVGC
ncbi:cellulose binding domain-containing protein [Cellulomonas palmilytica]|uniref:cellulose binding domain-containing protein n=1 Tax=Cellulomonas palmilytica TaxID=2608402 RepID=UPI001F413D18|nr:cellulose binding domain-containing protein [Cellulomonas palmilytica]UJP38582.1 cellulose binding domain-containing protein [Cellulomonas palmilytica]